MRITLRIQERAGAEREMTLESAVDVGRDVETPDIRIEDPTISRRHARLQPTDHGVQVTDLGSSNGTSVSGGPVPPGVPVLAADGAMIEMGDTTIHVSCRETDPARSDQTTSATAPLQSPVTLEPAPPESAPDRSPVARRRVSLDDLEVLENDAIVIRSMPGTLGSKAAAKVADATTACASCSVPARPETTDSAAREVYGLSMVDPAGISPRSSRCCSCSAVPSPSPVPVTDRRGGDHAQARPRARCHRARRLPLVAGVYRLMGAGAQKRSLAVQEQSSQLLSLTGENYAASPVVRMFGLAGRERDRFERTSQRLFRSQLRLNLYGGLFGLSVNMIVTILRLFVIGLGAWLILEGRFTIGGLVAFLGIMGEVISPVTVLTNIGQDLQAATGALQRVNEVLDAEPEVRDADDAIEAQPVSREIRFSSVSFSYDGTHQTLTDLDFTIPAGTRVAFVGPSGSGKSTVLRLLMRLYDPAEGALLVDGVDLRKLTTASYRDQMGVVFQDNFLFTTTLGENIALGRRGASENDVHDAARAAEVDAFIERLPRGYDTLVGERGGLLSGGQRQRVAIARALIRKPSVLLLDEATSALDPRTERQINDTLQRVAHGLTTVAVTHRLTAIVDYDRIFVLVEGRLVEQGSHSDLIAEGGVYAHLWAEQTGEAVPAGPDAFDPISVLAHLPPFAGLDKAALADVAGRLSAGSMEPGSVMTEGEGQLVLVVSGRAQVWQPGLGGPAVSAEFGAGDVFGLSALLGNTRDAELRAVDQCRIAVLDAATIRTLAERYPAVAAGLARGGSRVAPAAGGRQLTRATFAGLPQMTPDRPEGQQPAVDHRRIQQEVRRASGVYDRILP